MTGFDLFEVLNAGFITFIIFTYLHGIFKMKNIPRILVYAIYAAVFAIMATTTLMKLPQEINLIRSVAIFILILFLYDGKVIKKIYSTFLFFVFIFITETVATLVIMFVFGDTYDALPFQPTLRSIAIVLSDFLLFMAVIYTTKVFNKKIRNLPIRYWIVLILVPIFSVVLLQMMDYLLLETNTTDNLFIIAPLIVLLYINFMLFNFFETYDSQLKLRVMEELSVKNEENYKMLEISEKEIRILKHDINNHVMTMSNLIKTKDFNAAEDILKGLEDTRDKITHIVYTGNSTLDAVLNIKSKIAVSEGIKYTVKINLQNELKLAPIDICTVFNNAIDNAIEAARNTEEKFVHTSIDEIDGLLKISFENSSNKINFVGEEVLVSTKADKKNHGYGLRSIKEVVKRHSGNVSILYENGIFILNIIMNNKNCRL